jgi:hypothetical protein
MAQAIISRRGGGSGYATITFNGTHAFNRSYAPSLDESVGDLAATNIWHHSMYINFKDFALFGGGTTNGINYSSGVCSYNYSLAYVNLSSLSQARRGLAATTVGSYALFGGGYNDSYSSTVDAYDGNLTRSTPTSLSQARRGLAATTVGSYALFGGGYNGSYLSTVDAYDTSLTRSTPTSLDTTRYALAATHIGSYALFAGGGRDNIDFDVVDAYNTSLTRSTPTSLVMSRAFLAATRVKNGDYALFGGGKGLQASQYNRANVDAYDSNLTRTNPSYLSVARYNLAATEVGSYALFGGGNISYSSYSSTVDAYNKNLTRSTEIDFGYAKYQLAATTVGNYALFGGGFTRTVDAYKINSKVPVYPGTKYKLGGMPSESTSSTMQEIETTAPITGYIKIKDATIN